MRFPFKKITKLKVDTKKNVRRLNLHIFKFLTNNF